MTNYVISSVLWSLAGLVVGYLFGGVGRTVVVVTTEGAVAVAPKNPTSRSDKVIGVVVAGLAVVSVVVAAVTINRQQDLVECQTAFNVAFTDSLAQRSDAAAEERAAQRTLLTTQVTTPEDRRAALDRYLQALDRSDSRRDNNPLPLRPRC